MSRRMRGLAALGMSSAAVAAWWSVNSMLDWPEATQTSPTRMSSSVVGVAEADWIFMSKGPPALPGFRYKLQRPRLLDCVERDSPRKVTETFSPGEAKPQTWTGRSRWTTMWLARMAGRVT